MATAMAEKCQQAVLDKPGDEQLYRCMLEVGFLTHAAYDCPKKYSGKMVLDAIKSRMAAAGLKATQAHKDPQLSEAHRVYNIYRR